MMSLYVAISEVTNWWQKEKAENWMRGAYDDPIGALFSNGYDDYEV